MKLSSKGLKKLINSSAKKINFFKTSKGVLTLVGVAILGIVAFNYFSKNPLMGYTTGYVERGDVVSLVDVTGKIKPTEQVDLSVERGGRVNNIYVSVGEEVGRGETLLSLSNGDLSADYNEALANLEIEKLKLLEAPSTSEADLENSLNDLIDEIEEVYTSVDSEVSSTIDQFFDDLDSKYPTFRHAVISGGQSYNITVDIETRLDLKWMFIDLRESIDSLDSYISSGIDQDNLDQVISEAKTALNQSINLLVSIDTVLSEYNEQHLLTSIKSSVSTARNSLTTSLNSLRSVERTYRQAETESLSQGNDYQDVLLQQQRVNSAQARVNAILAEIEKTRIRAPFSGIVTKIDPKVGETVSSNTPLLSMMSVSDFEIETFVTEADISMIGLDNVAEVTLDAYTSEDIFEATVIFIDPAETLIEGVSTYKTLLGFVDPDDRIKSGMTANVDIIIDSAEDVLIVPTRSVIEKDGKMIVRKIVGENIEEVEVEVGIEGVSGDVEIKSGLSEGETIVIFSRN